MVFCYERRIGYAGSFFFTPLFYSFPLFSLLFHYLFSSFSPPYFHFFFTTYFLLFTTCFLLFPFLFSLPFPIKVDRVCRFLSSFSLLFFTICLLFHCLFPSFPSLFSPLFPPQADRVCRFLTIFFFSLMFPMKDGQDCFTTCFFIKVNLIFFC